MTCSSLSGHSRGYGLRLPTVFVKVDAISFVYPRWKCGNWQPSSFRGIDICKRHIITLLPRSPTGNSASAAFFMFCIFLSVTDFQKCSKRADASVAPRIHQLRNNRFMTRCSGAVSGCNMIAAPLTLLPFPEYAVGLVILNASRFICVCLNAQFKKPAVCDVTVT